MTIDFETLRDSRPRVKQDVIYARTPGGVIFHNASTGFQITSRSAYDFATKIVPHLNGTTRFADLYAVLPEPVRPLLVSMVASLLERGFVRDVEADAHVPEALTPPLARHFAAQINYIDHYEGSAKQRFLTLRSTSVAVLGDDATARFAVLGLIRNGVARVGTEPTLTLDGPRSSSISAELTTLAAAQVPAEVDRLAGGPLGWAQLDGYDYVLVTSTGAGLRMKALLDAGIPDGVQLLGALEVGRQTVIGPLMAAGRPGCTVCALLRLGQNGDPAQTADVWAQLASGATVPANPAASRALAAMQGNLLGYEVFRAATGAMPPETRDALLVQDRESADVASDTLQPHPRCPRCAPLMAPAALDLTAVVPLVESRVTPADVDRAEPQFEHAAAHNPLIGSAAGVFGGYEDSRYTQLPVRVGRIKLGLDSVRRRNVIAFDVHTTIAARLRAVHEAAVSYALSLDGVGSPAAPGARADARRTVTVAACSLAAVHGAVATDRFVGATTLLAREDVDVPAAAVWTHGAHNNAGAVHRSRAGAAAARTPALALGAAVLSALGADVLLAATANGDATRVDTPAATGDDQLDYVLGCAANLGVDLELFDLGGVRPESTVLARARAPRSGDPIWALATSLHWTQAAIDACTDVLGTVQVLAEGEDPDLGESDLESFDPFGLDVAATTKSVTELRARTTDLDAVLAHVRDEGRDLAIADLGTGDLTRGAVRVLRAVLIGEVG